MTVTAGNKFLLTAGAMQWIETAWKQFGFPVTALIGVGVLVCITFALLQFATDRLGG